MNKKSPRQKLLGLLRVIFPFLSFSQVWNLTFKISEGKGHSVLLFDNITESVVRNKDIKKNIEKMYRAGFDLEHILLYLKAPDVSPLKNETTKSEYLEKWSASNNFKPRINSIEIIERGKTAIGSMFVLSGMLVVGGTFAYGSLKTDIDMINAASELSKYGGDTVSLLGRALSDTSLMGMAVKLGTSLSLPAWSLAKLSLDAKKAKDFNLAKNLPVKLSDSDRENSIDKINNIPFHNHHLLSHLTGEELTLYLNKNDKLRHSMLKSNPPSFDQICKSILVDPNKRFIRKWRERLQVSLSSWEGNQVFNSPVTLKESVLKMRNKDLSPTSQKLKIT